MGGIKTFSLDWWPGRRLQREIKLGIKLGRLKKVRWCWEQLADKLEEELLGTSPSCHCCCAIPPDTIRPTMPLHSLLPTSIPTIPLSSYSAHVRPLGQVKKSIVATSFSRVDLYTFALAGWLSRVEYKNVLNDRREGSYLPDWDFNKFTNCQTLIFELKTRSTTWKYDCVWFIKAKYKHCNMSATYEKVLHVERYQGLEKLLTRYLNSSAQPWLARWEAGNANNRQFCSKIWEFN